MLTLVLDLVFEVERDVLEHVTCHSSNFYCVYKVEKGGVEALNRDEADFFGMPHVETVAAEWTDIAGCECLCKSKFMTHSPLLYKIHGVSEFSFLLFLFVKLLDLRFLRLLWRPHFLII